MSGLSIGGAYGMGKGQLKELKRLQKENERLRRAVSDRGGPGNLNSRNFPV